MGTKIADSLRTLIKKLHLAEAGATAVEYGLMVALIAAVIIGAVTTLGQNAEDCFDTVSDAIALSNTGGEASKCKSDG